MNYISTRGGGEPKSFEEVLLAGLAPDGGLYIPESYPLLDLAALKGKPYAEVAEAVMFPFVEGSIPREDFRSIIAETYSEEIFRDPDVVPLKPLSGDVHVLELFHGPTIAFKDVALQLLGRLFDYVLEKRGEHITIVGATSGDTGSAAIEGCRRSRHIDIFILFPDGRVSEVQRRQMTTVKAPNVHNIALEGTFDDCQAMVKAMFADETFRERVNLSAVNSINWARIMAQIVYYVYAALKLGAPEKEVSFVVPTGNFGNVFAGYCARRMGLPVKTLAIATNRNDILTRFFETGLMSAEEVVPTLSPSMDIQVSSNFERYLFEAMDRDPVALKNFMEEFKKSGQSSVLSEDFIQKTRNGFAAFRCGEDETLATMKQVCEDTGYVLDPHSAVGMKAAQALEAQGQGGAVVLLATAHPAKFPDAVERATGQTPALPDHLSDLLTREEALTPMPNDLEQVREMVLGKTNYS
ncbi:MAG: threonine synthase [Alphaproteobacteria bacterium]|nr:threonine synthase [Alphaproteobacteria bacterium]